GHLPKGRRTRNSLRMCVRLTLVEYVLQGKTYIHGSKSGNRTIQEHIHKVLYTDTYALPFIKTCIGMKMHCHMTLQLDRRHDGRRYSGKGQKAVTGQEVGIQGERVIETNNNGDLFKSAAGKLRGHPIAACT